jgi:hypothetical protein
VTRFLSHQQFLQRALDPLAQAVPALIGIFWGARCWPASWRPAPTASPGRRA